MKRTILFFAACDFAGRRSEHAGSAQEKKAGKADPSVATAKNDASAADEAKPAVIPATTDPAYVIGPEDVLDINVWKEPDMTRVVPVRPDGKISLPLINDVQAAGSTPQQLAATVTEKLRKYLTEPQVTVIVTQINSQRVFVVGEVLRAGAFPLVPGTTVLQALASAGGFTTFADVKKIHVMRLRRRQAHRIALQLPGSPQGRQSGPKYQAGAGRHGRRPVRGETMKLRNTNWALVVALVLCATAAFAQDQKQDTVADRSRMLRSSRWIRLRPSGGNGINRPSARYAALTCRDTQPYDPAQVTPDKNTLAGAEPFTLGSLQHTRNTFDPTISISQLGQTIPGNAGQDSPDGHIRGQRQPEFQSHLEPVSLFHDLQRR